MAAMATTLTEFAVNGNSITYTQPAHTTAKPLLVLQKRKVAAGNQKTVEDTISVLSATEDSLGESLPSRVLFTATIRRPVDGIAADVTAMLAVFRDIITGDEFANVVSTQEYLV